MANHPNRARIDFIRVGDGKWARAKAGLRIFDQVRAAQGNAAATAALLSLVLGTATRKGRGYTYALVDFGCDAMARWIDGGDVEDPVIRAFFNRRGTLRRDELERAARLVLAERRTEEA